MTRNYLLDLTSYLSERQSLVNEALDRYLPSAGEIPAVLHESMRYSVINGGKRLRPVLLLAACEAVGGSIDDAMPAACALEMIHAFSLIHDDLPCMDDDDYRRGKLTNHKVYGEATALLAGDGLLVKAFETITANKGSIPADSLIKVVRTVAAATGNTGMIGGQVLDMESEGKDVDLEDVKAIHSRKTGALLTASMVCGGLIGGGSDEDIDALRTYGEKVGMAFQIADDILDLVGDEAKLGKPVRSDLKQAKATYPRVLGIDKSLETAQKAVQDATDAVGRFGSKADPLVAIARFIVEREY